MGFSTSYLSTEIVLNQSEDDEAENVIETSGFCPVLTRLVA